MWRSQFFSNRLMSTTYRSASKDITRDNFLRWFHDEDEKKRAEMWFSRISSTTSIDEITSKCGIDCTPEDLNLHLLKEYMNPDDNFDKPHPIVSVPPMMSKSVLYKADYAKRPEVNTEVVRILNRLIDQLEKKHEKNEIQQTVAYLIRQIEGDETESLNKYDTPESISEKLREFHMVDASDLSVGDIVVVENKKSRTHNVLIIDVVQKDKFYIRGIDLTTFEDVVFDSSHVKQKMIHTSLHLNTVKLKLKGLIPTKPELQKVNLKLQGHENDPNCKACRGRHCAHTCKLYGK